MHLGKLENIINQTYNHNKLDPFILKINQILNFIKITAGMKHFKLKP